MTPPFNFYCFISPLGTENPHLYVATTAIANSSF
nr:MAG TPA: hypothetical protein [Caudoviricetes sp.]